MLAFEVYMQKKYPNIEVNSGDYIHSWHLWVAALKWALAHELCDSQGCQYLIDEIEIGN